MKVSRAIIMVHGGEEFYSSWERKYHGVSKFYIKIFVTSQNLWLYHLGQ